MTTAGRGAARGRAAMAKSGRPQLGGSRHGEKRVTTAGSERPQQGTGGVAGNGRPRRRRAWAQRRTVAARRRMSRHSGERATTAGSGRRCWERAAAAKSGRPRLGGSRHGEKRVTTAAGGRGEAAGGRGRRRPPCGANSLGGWPAGRPYRGQSSACRSTLVRRPAGTGRRFSPHRRAAAAPPGRSRPGPPMKKPLPRRFLQIFSCSAPPSRVTIGHDKNSAKYTNFGRGTFGGF